MTYVVIPAAALDADCMAGRPERFLQFARLCDEVASRDGIYHVKGGLLARLWRGQIVISQSDLAVLWGVSKSTARRSMEAFERSGLVTVQPGEDAAVPDEEPPREGSLVTVVGLAEAPSSGPKLQLDAPYLLSSHSERK